MVCLFSQFTIIYVTLYRYEAKAINYFSFNDLKKVIQLDLSVRRKED